jgi:hypothetical protein
MEIGRNPENIFMEDVERRLRALEGGTRTGLSKMGVAEWNSVGGFGSLVVGGAWADPLGLGPVVTIETGERVLVIAMTTIYLMPQAITKATQAGISFEVSGATTIAAGYPRTRESLMSSTSEIYISCSVSLSDLVTVNRGENTFHLMFKYAFAGGGAGLPTFENALLAVIPL